MERLVTQNPILVLLVPLVLLLFSSSNCFALSENDDIDKRVWIKIGLVLDLGSVEGKIVETSVSMALSDFYTINHHYKTRISFSVRDSHGDPLLALSTAVDLVQSVGVEAIISGNSFLETKLLAEIGEKAKVPVISLNSPYSLSLNKYSHLIQVTHDSVSEAKGITSFIHGFGWNSVALVYEDDDDWRESMHILMYHFHEKGVQIRSNIGFTVSSSESLVMDQLGKLKDLGGTVFVGHLSESLATYLFTCAEKLGMMDPGFAWILTSKSMDSFHAIIDDSTKEAMEGVVGFKTYIPVSTELQDFTLRWKKSLLIEEVIRSEITRLSISGVWAHDFAGALARAVEVTRMPNVSSNLLEAITKTRFKGLSGDFQVDGKKVLSHKFEIVNFVGSGERRIGFWNSNGTFSNRRRHLSATHNNNLGTIIWPGGSAQSPKGRNLRENEKTTLRVLVTSSNRFPRLMKVETNNVTKVTTADGFCIEVFLASIAPFNYEVEYIPWLGGSNYDKLALALSTQKDKYDAAVGDITITPNRSKYVDFTMPFTDMGLGIVAPKERSMWVFFQPLTPDLWITSASFFVLTGIVVWLIERSENIEFQGSWSQQIGVVLWYGFSTLVYAHRERLHHNLSRFVVTIWVFAVLILAASYTATLTTMMTVRQIRFNSNKDYVGHLSGSFIANAFLTGNSKLQRMGLNTSEDYARALLNNTVSHVIDEMPYLKVLLGENPSQFIMVKTQGTTNGFGFMFQKGSKLVSNISREISKLRMSGRLNEMEKTWFNNQLLHTTDDTLDPINFYTFRGLFMIIGISFALALLVLVIPWLREKLNVLENLVKVSFLQLLVHFRILFVRPTHPSPFDDASSESSVRGTQRNRQ